MEYAATATPIAATDEQGFLAKVFGWMFLGLAITGGMAAATSCASSAGPGRRPPAVVAHEFGAIFPIISRRVRA